MSIETIRFRDIVSVLPHASAISPRPDQQRGSLKTKRDENLAEIWFRAPGGARYRNARRTRLVAT